MLRLVLLAKMQLSKAPNLARHAKAAHLDYYYYYYHYYYYGDFIERRPYCHMPRRSREPRSFLRTD
jgi:hypothetical protein